MQAEDKGKGNKDKGKGNKNNRTRLDNLDEEL